MAPKRKPRKVSKKVPVTPVVAGPSEAPVEAKKEPVVYRHRRIVSTEYGRIREGYDPRSAGYGRQTYH